MANQKFDDFEDECLNCGELEYQRSKTPGLCIHCNPSDQRHLKTPSENDGVEELI